jgi:predicted MFS family arabinose efflux permease
MIDRLRSSGATLAVALVLNVVAPSTFNILPLLAEGAVHTLGFSEREIGVMSVAISIGSGASALFGGMWVRSVRWPHAAMFALGGMFASNSLAMLLHSHWTFVLMQGMAGFFGGSVFCLAATIMSDRPDSARIFGIAGALQVAYQVAALFAGPTLLRLAGLDGVLAMLAALSGLAMFLAPMLPAHGRVVLSAGVPTALLRPATLIGLLAFAVYFVNAGAYWTYIELIGQARGMTSTVVSNCIAAGVSAGILGGASAWTLGDRLGKLWPLGVAAFLTVGAALLLKGSFSVRTFMISGLLYYFAWNYSLAYQYANISAVDATGRGVAISGAFCYLGTGGGAALAALFVKPGDYHTVIWMVIVAVCVSTVLFAVSSGVHRQGSLRCQRRAK